MPIRHEITGEGFTHVHLWKCARTLLTQPETKSPKDRYYCMAGMVMAYLAFEAYLNFGVVRKLRDRIGPVPGNLKRD